jgi:hypothetical protein
VGNADRSYQRSWRGSPTVPHICWPVSPLCLVRGSRDPTQLAIAVSNNGWTNNELGVAWLKHFNAYTKTRVVGTRRLPILDGYESHHSLEFQEYYKENNIYTLCMPPHSSHLLQPLDVGCFSPLKRAYSREVESLIRHHINHITKLELLTAFEAVFDRSPQ